MANEEEKVSQAQHREVLDALAKHDTLFGEIKNTLQEMKERLRQHYENEHKDFQTVVDAYKSTKWASKIILWMVGGLVAIIAGAAHAWDWIMDHYHILPK